MDFTIVATDVDNTLSVLEIARLIEMDDATLMLKEIK
jgi:hypothetical protein